MTLQLPTVPGTKFKTKTITNSSHPVWNETFSFLIQSQVKVKARTTHLGTGCLLLSMRALSSRAQSEPLGRSVFEPNLRALCGRERVTHL